jgi:hypothetical protein
VSNQAGQSHDVRRLIRSQSQLKGFHASHEGRHCACSIIEQTQRLTRLSLQIVTGRQDQPG